MGNNRNQLLIGLLAVLAATIGARADVARLGYNRDVRPILSDNCFACHGPDKNKRKAKLRLDDRDSALGLKVFVPGKPDESELVKRIFSSDPKEQMPPPKSAKRLNDAQKQVLKRWIAEGAEYEPFWAYVNPHRPPVPVVKNLSWARNPIDAFIAAPLEAKGFGPSPEADRRTLLRRLSLDLIGIPPAPEELQAFLDDKSPDAYEKQVDRLLASPHYGERMAVPWLDAVRFADTVGFHGDQNQNVFPYRDYVINAFNSNKPFDQFTREQLAGDLLPNPTTEQLVATGFNRLNMMTREGGAQAQEYLAKYTADRVRTTGSAFLGSTLACCECHDHKYDPFSTRDFYSMGAFFADVKQWGIYTTYDYTPNPDLKGFTNDHPFPPEIVVDSPYLKKRERRLVDEIDQIASRVCEKRNAEFEAWRRSVREFLQDHADGWVDATAMESRHARPTDDGAVLLTEMTDSINFSLRPGTYAAIRLELLPADENGGSILRDKATAATVRLTASLQSNGDENRLAIFYSDADQKEERYSNGSAILGLNGDWRIAGEHLNEPQTAVYLLESPAKVTEGDRLVINLGSNAPLACIRVSVSPLAPLKPTDSSFMQWVASSLEAGAKDPQVRRTFLLSTACDANALAMVRGLEREVYECRDGKSPSLVTVSTKPMVVRVLPRGNWQDESGPIVQPAVPHFLPQPAGSAGERLTRLDLANWIVSPQNPLTSRVIVNRLWKQFFGTGICSAVEDLGSQGDWPSHPELLDWLAVEFRESGWDIKHMVRLMVTSSTYMQDSNLRPELREIDPNNRLLSCQSPRRLEAEFVRDNALAISGLLNLADIGGPSIHPYQPEGYYANIQFPDRRYVPEHDDRQWRRGVYMHWQRTFLHPMLANFDAPGREDSVCTRVVSNTPQQALTLLNDPEFVEAARVLAEHVIASAKGDGARLDQIYQRALCRVPTGAQRQSLEQFLAGQRSYFNENPEDAKKLVHTGIAPIPSGIDEAELAAWTSVCRVVLNLHETITRY